MFSIFKKRKKVNLQGTSYPQIEEPKVEEPVIEIQKPIRTQAELNLIKWFKQCCNDISIQKTLNHNVHYLYFYINNTKTYEYPKLCLYKSISTECYISYLTFEVSLTYEEALELKKLYIECSEKYFDELFKEKVNIEPKQLITEKKYFISRTY